MAPAPPPPPVKIVVRATPKALVVWGKEELGLTPLTVERPRDSGPLDLVLRADGYLPYHVRAFTFRNDSLTVKLTRLGEQHSLLGAKRDSAASPPPAVASPSP